MGMDENNNINELPQMSSEVQQQQTDKKSEQKQMPPVPEFMLRNRDRFAEDYKRILEKRTAGKRRWKWKRKNS